MAVGQAAIVTGRSPRADAAVGDRERVRLDPNRESILEPTFRCPEIGREFNEPQRYSLVTTEHDMDVLRWASLEASQLLGVLTELEHGRGPHPSSQLGVLGLIREGPELAFGLDAANKIGMATPGRSTFIAGVEERRLIDDRDTGPQRPQRVIYGIIEALLVHLNNAESGISDLSQICRLVLEAAALYHRKLGILSHGCDERAVCHRERLLGQVFAGEVSHEIGRAENKSPGTI